MSVSPGMSGSAGEMTFIEKMNANEELFESMLSMPTWMNESMVNSRREENFEMFWTETSMSKSEVISMVEAREEDFINEHSDVSAGLPEWVLRAEAQDVLLEVIHQKFEEEGLL